MGYGLMDYNKLPVILKRYSFEEKMRVLQFYSRDLMNITGVELKDAWPLPWELETFLLFSVKFLEYQQKDFAGKNINVFINIINSIKNHQHPKSLKYAGTIKSWDLVLVAFGSTQFDIQSYNIYKYYRYNYFFNYIGEEVNMKQEFKNKFNVNYDMFLKLGFSLSTFCSLKVNLNPQILKYIVLKYIDVTTKLMLSREDFSNKIDEYSYTIDDYLYCIRPSYLFPFIEYNGVIHLPLPHCLTRAITDSLLYRLTDENNELRTIFGKNVLEDYLYDIVYESNLYEEVLKEHEYHMHRNLMKTPDVMVRNGNEYLFFESKASVPYAKTRILEESYLENEIEKISDAVIQLYKQLYNYFGKYFNFFSIENPIINVKKIFGVVVLLEESYIRRDLIYSKVLEKMKLSKENKKYRWLVNHIKVCNLYDIERYMFTSTDVLQSIKQQSNYNDYPLRTKTNGSLQNKNVRMFKENLIIEVEKMKNELYEHKLI